jgi:hypothetical protein
MNKKPVDWDKVPIENIIWYLEIKYQFLNTADAKCIRRLLEYYKQTKDGQNIINKD